MVKIQFSTVSCLFCTTTIASGIIHSAVSLTRVIIANRFYILFFSLFFVYYFLLYFSMSAIASNFFFLPFYLFLLFPRPFLFSCFLFFFIRKGIDKGRVYGSVIRTAIRLVSQGSSVRCITYHSSKIVSDIA